LLVNSVASASCCILSYQSHDAGKESFKVDDSFGALDASAFEGDCVTHNLRFDCFCYAAFALGWRLEEFTDKVLEDKVSGDTLCQKLI
jgi:hypothetical protein